MRDLTFLKLSGDPNQPLVPDFNDIEPDGNGNFLVLKGPDRVSQDVVKGLATALGSNVVFPEYGSSLPSLPGTENIDVNKKIMDSVTSLISLLSGLETSSDPSEQLAGFKNVKITPVQNNTGRQVNMDIRTKDNSVILLKQVF